MICMYERRGPTSSCIGTYLKSCRLGMDLIKLAHIDCSDIYLHVTAFFESWTHAAHHRQALHKVCLIIFPRLPGVKAMDVINHQFVQKIMHRPIWHVPFSSNPPLCLNAGYCCLQPACQPCPQGSYCSQGTSTSVLCPPGMYTLHCLMHVKMLS